VAYRSISMIVLSLIGVLSSDQFLRNIHTNKKAGKSMLDTNYCDTARCSVYCVAIVKHPTGDYSLVFWLINLHAI
jgi:hypothetical protein